MAGHNSWGLPRQVTDPSQPPDPNNPLNRAIPPKRPRWKRFLQNAGTRYIKNITKAARVSAKAGAAYLTGGAPAAAGVIADEVAPEAGQLVRAVGNFRKGRLKYPAPPKRIDYRNNRDYYKKVKFYNEQRRRIDYWNNLPQLTN